MIDLSAGSPFAYAVALILVLCFLPHGVAGTIERRMKNKRKALAYKEMQA